MKRIVIKIGSSTITRGSGPPDSSYIAELGAQVAAQVRLGRAVVIVTSGAIAAGMDKLGLAGRPRTIPQKQAAAAVGQGLLMHEYAHAFGAHGLAVAQVLLTREDLQDRGRYVNASNTLNALLRLGAIPIINENDTIAVEEIKFGDNDTLAALVGTLADADAVLLLSDVDGLYTANPAQDPDARLIPVVDRIDRGIERLAGGAGSSVGTGGMRTKLQAAKICASSGIALIIANGSRPNVVTDALAGKCGTWFTAAVDHPLRSRKRWIAFGGAPKGHLVVNEGARAQLVRGGKSLLAAGIVAVEGEFACGDLVDVASVDGAAFAQGLVSYDSASIARIQGRRSSEIARILGEKTADEVVHRDNLVLLRPAG
ncbi:MAG: glutamate 5-kinase [Capsulimonadaceae bacterium]|nr:glutamate 5-kinase [Capsulimonadaceae bacterium]